MGAMKESARSGARLSRIVSLVACTMGIIGTGGARPVWKSGEILAMGCIFTTNKGGMRGDPRPGDGQDPA